MKKVILILMSFILVVTLSGCSKYRDVKPSLEQVRSISNLSTLDCYYHNVAKGEKTKGTGIAHLGEKDRKIWIEYTGIVSIGIDMKKVDMKVKGSNIVISIPKAEVLSVEIDDDSFNEDSFVTNDDSFFNKNKITSNDQKKIIKESLDTMRNEASNDEELLKKAQNRAKSLIKSYIDEISNLSGINYTIEWKEV